MDNYKKLKTLLRQAITIESFTEFQQAIAQATQ